MKRKLRESYWWPGLDTQVETIVRTCSGCQLSEKSQPPDPVPPITIPKPTIPWKQLGLNISGPSATAPHREQFVVSVVDYHSGYPEVLLTTNICSLAIICWLKELFARHGCPEEMVMDNGWQFASSEFQQFLSEYGVHALITMVYNPRENGLAERWNKMLKFGVQAFTSTGRLWEDGILELLAQHRHMPSTPQGSSPAELLFGRKTRMAFEVRPQDTGHILSTLRERGETGQSFSLLLTKPISGPKVNDSPVEDESHWSHLRPLFRPGDMVLV